MQTIIPRSSVSLLAPSGSDASEERRHADWLLNGIIKPVFSLSLLSYKVERADEIVTWEHQLSVITRILDAPLVIRSMSMHNAMLFMSLRFVTW